MLAQGPSQAPWSLKYSKQILFILKCKAVPNRVEQGSRYLVENLRGKRGKLHGVHETLHGKEFFRRMLYCHILVY